MERDRKPKAPPVPREEGVAWTKRVRDILRDRCAPVEAPLTEDQTPD